MKKLYVGLLCVIALCVYAGVKQSGWTETTNPATARTALDVFSKSESTNLNALNVTNLNAVNATFSSPYSVSNATATASAVTNYTADFTLKEIVIVAGNTNANIIVTNAVAGKSMSVWVNALDSTNNCVVGIPSNLITNESLSLIVSNGTFGIYNFTAFDGTLTNILVINAGTFRR